MQTDPTYGQKRNITKCTIYVSVRLRLADLGPPTNYRRVGLRAQGAAHGGPFAEDGGQSSRARAQWGEATCERGLDYCCSWVSSRWVRRRWLSRGRPTLRRGLVEKSVASSPSKHAEIHPKIWIAALAADSRCAWDHPGQTASRTGDGPRARSSGLARISRKHWAWCRVTRWSAPVHSAPACSHDQIVSLGVRRPIGRRPFRIPKRWPLGKGEQHEL